MCCHLLFLAPITWSICCTYVWRHPIVLCHTTHVWSTQSLSNLEPQPKPTDNGTIALPTQTLPTSGQCHEQCPTPSAHLPNSLDLPFPQRVVSSSSSYVCKHCIFHCARRMQISSAPSPTQPQLACILEHC